MHIPRWLRWTLIGLAACAGLAIATRWMMQAAKPDSFYSPPPEVLPAAGTLLRAEPFTRRVPTGATGWRILYTTTTTGGPPALASAIVMVSKGQTTPRPVIAWSHGTTGVARGCAPSLLDEPFAHVPAIEAALARGWAFVATDYVGQGTAGPHPYLIGDGEARSVLDAVRAARQLTDAAVGDQVVVWGHSQGGHAALWAGMLAPRYAPELRIAGVAAMAPATDLPAMLTAVHDTAVGRIISGYLLNSYSRTYPDVRMGDHVSGFRSVIANDLANHCMNGSSAWLAVLDALAARGSLFDGDPVAGALAVRLKANVPHEPLPAPLWIAQGTQDELVLPQIQDAYVASRCAAGQSIQYVRVAERDHLSLVATDSPLSGWLEEWTADRLAGVATAMGCAMEHR